jgi:hypothetical protein
MKKFKVVKCRCGNVRVISAEKVFKCFGCGKSIKIISKPKGLLLTHLNVTVLFQTDYEHESKDFIQELNKSTDLEFYSFVPKQKD